MKKTIYVFARPNTNSPEGYDIFTDQCKFYNFPLLGEIEVDISPVLPPVEEILKKLHEHLDEKEKSIREEINEDLRKVKEERAALLTLTYQPTDNKDASTTGEPPTGGTLDGDASMNAEVLSGTDVEYIVEEEKGGPRMRKKKFPSKKT